MDKNISTIIALGGHVDLTAPLIAFFPVPETEKLLAVFLEEGTAIKVTYRDKNQVKGKVIGWRKIHVVGDFKGTELEQVVDDMMARITDFTFTTSEVDLVKALYVPKKDRHRE